MNDNNMLNETYVKFADMKQGVVYCQPVLVLGMEEKKTKNGKAFMNFKLSDGSGTVQANLFGMNTEDMDILEVEPGKLAFASVVIRDQYYNLNEIIGSVDDTVSIEDFIRTVPVDTKELFDGIMSTVLSTERFSGYTTITELTMKLLTAHREEFITSSAAKTIHHNIKGGLVYHTARMVAAAKKISEVYTDLNEQLLVCGAALHDIGKLVELKTDAYGEAEYTGDGRLFGHSHIGMCMIDEAARDTDARPEDVKLLKHMIAAHHGKLEFGAIATPAIPEAACLHAIDMIDSRMYQFEEVGKSIQPGEQSAKVFGLENSTVYMPANV